MSKNNKNKKKNKNLPLRRTELGQKVRRNDNIFLHIGKTGGTSVGTVIKDLKSQGCKNLPVKVGHSFTLQDILGVNPSAEVSFLLRDPADRFVSGFNSRLRSGRPAHEHIWSAAEAAVYAFFPTANDLAEALYSSDERLLSAAHFAMAHNGHLRRGYQFYFGSSEALKQVEANIGTVALTHQLDKVMEAIFAPAGVTPADLSVFSRHAHAAPKPAAKLSEKAAANLRRYLAAEYELYDFILANYVK